LSLQMFIYFRCLYQNPSYSCHGIVVFCVQYIYYILKRNGQQTRCNFHNHNYYRQLSYLWIDHIWGYYTFDVSEHAFKNTLITLKDLSTKFIYWIYIRRQRPCIYVSVFVLKDKYYTHGIVVFCVQYIYYILKRIGQQTRCNFHNHNYKRQLSYLWIDHIWGYYIFDVSEHVIY
jgi:hypothetical protein